MKEYIKLKRRIVYRGDVYNAIEGERINVLPEVFDSEYMNGIHDGLKKALSTLANDVKDIPAADVVEVVRCRDCKWRPYNMGEESEVHRLDFPCIDGEEVCPYSSGDPWYNREPDPEGYCHLGEREVVDNDS